MSHHHQIKAILTTLLFHHSNVNHRCVKNVTVHVQYFDYQLHVHVAVATHIGLTSLLQLRKNILLMGGAVSHKRSRVLNGSCDEH